MDPRTLLDHAVFQLTPTRTRCDLVIFAVDGGNEKLASGILEPFVLHLKSAKDQISKGGYSVLLRPLASNAYWFTKATLQRFVKFVSTPEILERFVTIETELEQIESSVQSNELSNTDAEGAKYQKSSASYKSKGDYDGGSDAVQEENSKIRLQRALDSRRAVLHKEQAMAYARALVTGFEPDSMNDLICFAEAFGASRLREACLNFMELCKKKNQDRLWMDEIAAMQAARLELPYIRTSGIVLASEENYPNQMSSLSVGKQTGSIDAFSESSIGSVDLNQDSSLPSSTHLQSTDGKAQVPMPWPNNFPQYMHNFQGPVYQQGYLYPGMQVAPPYFQGNMQWPPKMDDGREWEPDDHKKHKSSSRKKKSSHRKGAETSNQDDSTELSDSCSETESDEDFQNGEKQMHRRKHGKKSSRKVVIRNINYITSKRDGEDETSNEDEFIDGEVLKQQVEEAVGSLQRRHKSTSRHHNKSHRSTIDVSNDEDDKVATNNPDRKNRNEHWGAFQSLLLQDKDDSFETERQRLPVEEYFTMKSSEKGRSSALNLESEDIRKQRAISNDSFLAAKTETSNNGEYHLERFEAGENLKPMTNKRDSTYEEMLFSQRTEESRNWHATVSDQSIETLMIKTQKEGDWFVGNGLDKQTYKDENVNYASSMTDDHFKFEKSKNDVLVDDSFMIQARPMVNDQSESILRTDISMAADIVEATQYENSTLKISHEKAEGGTHEPDDLYMVLGRDSVVENPISALDYENDVLSTEINGRHSSLEINVAEDKPLSNAKGTNGRTGGKLSSKEARSKVANGSLTKSKSDFISRTNKTPTTSRSTVQKGKSSKEEEKRKRMEELLLQRQKRIAERSANANSMAASKRTPAKKLSTGTSSKNEEATKKAVFKSSTIDRLATARSMSKVESTQSKASQPKKAPLMKANSRLSQKTGSGDNKKPSLNNVKADHVPRKEEIKEATAEKPTKVPFTQAYLPVEAADELKDIKKLSSIALVEQNQGTMVSERDASDDKAYNSSSLQIDLSSKQDHLKGNHEELSITVPIPHEDAKSSEYHGSPTLELPTHHVQESPNKTLNLSAVHIIDNGETEIEVSTPPRIQISPEPVYSRKKWNDETSPKVAKGFRKLLLFGKKSRNSIVTA